MEIPAENYRNQSNNLRSKVPLVSVSNESSEQCLECRSIRDNLKSRSGKDTLEVRSPNQNLESRITEDSLQHSDIDNPCSHDVDISNQYLTIIAIGMDVRNGDGNVADNPARPAAPEDEPLKGRIPEHPNDYDSVF